MTERAGPHPSIPTAGKLTAARGSAPSDPPRTGSGESTTERRVRPSPQGSPSPSYTEDESGRSRGAHGTGAAGGRPPPQDHELRHVALQVRENLLQLLHDVDHAIQTRSWSQ